MSTNTALGRLFARARSRTVLVYIIGGVFLVAAVIASVDLVHHVAAIEAWIAHLGVWGITAFIVLFVIATSLLVPESVLAMTAGVLFGFAWGLGAVMVGTFIAASFQYALSRWFLRNRIATVLESRPSLRAIQQAVLTNEFKLQVLLRLTPLNPATISYMLGATGVRFSTFLLSCFALVPHAVIEVYFGYAGQHAAQMVGRDKGGLNLHDFVIFAGFVVTVIVVAVVAKIAHKAVVEAASQVEASASAVATNNTAPKLKPKPKPKPKP